MAERIGSHFDQETLCIIEDEPDRLVGVPDLGPKHTARIVSGWAEQKKAGPIRPRMSAG